MSREKLSDSPLKKVVWQAVIDGPLIVTRRVSITTMTLKIR